MRGTLFGIIALGVFTALLPAIFDFDGVDGLGSDFIGVIDAFAGPVIVSLFLVACAALVVSYMTTDSF